MCIRDSMEDALSQTSKLMTHSRQQSKYAPLRLFQAFDSAARHSHPIKDDTIAVITPYGRGEECREKHWNMNPHTEMCIRDSSLRSATKMKTEYLLECYVSIHALLAECDFMSLNIKCGAILFQSTHSLRLSLIHI